MEQVAKLSRPAIKMILAICLSSLAFILGGIIYFRSIEALPFALGVIFAAVFNIIKVSMLVRTVKTTAKFTDEAAGRNYALLQFFLRYMLTGLVLLVAALAPFLSLWGAIAGVFTLQIATLSLKYTEPPRI